MELLFVVTLSLFVVLLAKCVVSGTTNCLGGLLPCVNEEENIK